MGAAQCCASSEDGSAALRVARAKAEELANMGVSLRQLLDFYITNETSRRINEWMFTYRVVREIIIPESALERRCYMESSFMMSRGGAKRAKKLVSHSWDVRFVHTVLNIVQDATGWSTEEMIRRCAFVDYRERYEERPNMRALKQDIEEELGSQVLDNSTYWLCIFAVNQHASICGDCPCRGGKDWTREQFAADPCAGCRKLKDNPCVCGMPKTGASGLHCEVNKLEHVVQLMEGGVVLALDPELRTLSRLWVVREVGEALRGVDVRISLAMGMYKDVREAVLGGEDRLLPAREPDVTSDADSARLFFEIGAMEGGRLAFYDFVFCYVDLCLGRSARLAESRARSKERQAEPDITEGAIQALVRLEKAEMDFQWCAAHLRDQNLEQLGHGTGSLGRLAGLQSLVVNLSGCKLLTHLGFLRGELHSLPTLKRLTLKLPRCEGLTNVAGLGEGVSRQAALQQVSLDFSSCKALREVAGLGQGLGRLPALQRLSVTFSGCTALQEVTALGQGIGKLLAMRRLSLDFSGCLALTDVAPLGTGFAQLQALQELSLSLASCKNLQDATVLGKGLSKMKELRHLSLDLSDCEALKGSLALGAGLGRLQVLNGLTLSVAGCRSLEDVGVLGEAVGKLQRLQQLTLNVLGCKTQQDVAAVSAGLGRLRALQQLTLKSGSCKTLLDTAALGKALGRLPLKQLSLSLSFCESLKDLTGLVAGLGQLQELQQLSLDFSHCRALSNSRKLTDCLSKLPALQQLSLYAYNSPLQFQLQELCEEIGKRGVKVVNW